MDADIRLPEVVALTKALIACESVTPAQGSVFDILEAALAPLGFHVDRFIVGEAPDGPVENLLAVRGSGAPHFAFAGHLDVVPPGAGWTSGAFEPEIRGGLLHGRGAVDMKGAIAAFVAALGRAPAMGTQSLIITGDEEGPAIFGTRALIDRMSDRGLKPDFCLVGEPTSVTRLGDMIKIGRRGSVNIWIDVPGRQGHVAYPHLADNPIPKLVAILAEIDAIEARQGVRPELSTTGGTSDARFLSALCPVVEFGLINATMHKLDEAVAIDDLVALTDIYADIIGHIGTSESTS